MSRPQQHRALGLRQRRRAARRGRSQGRVSGPARFRVPGLRNEAGQGSVELVALLPLVFVLSFAAFALLAARSVSGEAAAGAHAGAMALLQEEDAAAAARAAVPATSRGRTTIRVAGRRVTVTVRPRALVPFLDGALAATASATAGPEPGP